ncbi:MAG TPA: hypothetical protein VJN18_25950 [Polyangiaceae bacterium]|nr:hypothetical protein [Polyangiaceae bacterium]
MRIGSESPRYELVPIEPETTSGAQRSIGPQPSASSSGAAFAQALQGIGGAIDRGEALIARATRGRLGGLDSAQLIALQAGIYRYSEAVDLVAKLVDRASSAVRTVVSPH